MVISILKSKTPAGTESCAAGRQRLANLLGRFVPGRRHFVPPSFCSQENVLDKAPLIAAPHRRKQPRSLAAQFWISTGTGASLSLWLFRINASAVSSTI
jgi:hypothetical protein